jgi:hypothetical protein
VKDFLQESQCNAQLFTEKQKWIKIYFYFQLGGPNSAREHSHKSVVCAKVSFEDLVTVAMTIVEIRSGIFLDQVINR